MSDKLKILFTNPTPLIKYGLKAGFDNLGHETYVMDDVYRLWDKTKEEQVILLNAAINEYKPDLIFSECFSNFSENLFLLSRIFGIPHFFWSIEDTPRDHWIGDYWSDYADYVFTTTAECLPNYWNKGKKAELMLFACNPNFHKRYESNIERDIILVANNYDRRSIQTKNFIMPFVENDYDISIYGNEWWLSFDKQVQLINYSHVYKGYGAYEDLPKLYSSSKVVLGQNLDGDSVTQTSMRMVETLGIGGGLLVSPWTIGQQYLFHDHIYLAKNSDEMISMVNEILNMTDQQRELKAKEAQQYVYKYHNYTLRAQQVIDAFRKDL